MLTAKGEILVYNGQKLTNHKNGKIVKAFNLIELLVSSLLSAYWRACGFPQWDTAKRAINENFTRHVSASTLPALLVCIRRPIRVPSAPMIGT